MASIQARTRADGSKAYRVMFRIDGRQTSESFDDSRTAAEFAQLVDRIGGQAARDVRDARSASGRTLTIPTIGDYLEHYLEHLTGVTTGTVAEYRRLAARTWLPHLEHLPVDALNRDHVRRWIGAQARTVTNRGKPTAPKTIANAHGILSALMASAVEAGHRSDNPCRGIALPTGEREEMVFLSGSEFAQLLAEIPPQWKPLITTFAGTGLRWGEATALRWGDIDLEATEPVLRVSRAWKRGPTVRELGAPKTGRGRRTISLPEQVTDALWPLRRSPDDLVFTSNHGGPVHHQAFHPRVWIPAVTASGIGKRPRIHDLRHSHASWLIAAGVPLPIIQRRLGHESIKTTVDVYGHLANDAQGIAARASTVALAQALPRLELS